MEKYEDVKEKEGYPKIKLGQAKDLRSQIFGRLIPLYRTELKGKKGTYWVCQCNCKNHTIKSISAISLTTGRTQSCGCLHKEQMSELFGNNLLNKRFGKLTVIAKTNKRTAAGKVIWLCKCDCGKEVEVVGGHLLSGHTSSCGCYKKERISEIQTKNLVGQHFGKLIVLELTEKRNRRQRVWKCKCDCGNIAYVPSNSLTSGNTCSCGKCNFSKGEARIKNILQKNNIKFENQKIFKTCRFLDSKYYAKFDFYLPEYDYLIEYDGEQHFKTSSRGWDTQEALEATKKRDAFKNQWCNDNNIPLIRIPYTRLNDLCLSDLLLETTKYRVV